jgi:transcriptional regulator with XRE-family HTH domain
VAGIREWTGREVRALRDALGMSPRELGTRLGVSDRVICKWEAGPGEAIPREDKRAMLDKLLGRVSEDAHARFRQFLMGEPETAATEVASGPGDLYDIALPYMDQRGMSGRALARAVYRDPSLVSKALHGKRACGPALARAIDDAIGADGEFIKAAEQMDLASRLAISNPQDPAGVPVPSLAEDSTADAAELIRSAGQELISPLVIEQFFREIARLSIGYIGSTVEANRQILRREPEPFPAGGPTEIDATISGRAVARESGKAGGGRTERVCDGCGLPLSRCNPGEFCQACVSRDRKQGESSGKITVNGQKIAELRRSRGWTQGFLADRIGFSTETVKKLEQNARGSTRLTTLGIIASALNVPLAALLELPASAAQGFPQESHSAASETGFGGITGEVRETQPATGDVAPDVIGIIGEDQEEEMERRRLLQSLAALGVEISPLSQALETVRTVFGDTVGYDERHHLDHWEEAAVDYGYSYLATSPADLIPDLAADLVAVRSVMRRIPDKDSSEYRSWCRVGGAFSALMAKSLSNFGQPRGSREWWSVAQHLTDASGDLNLALWVRGERIIHGFYENRPVPALLRQVESAADLAHDHPCAGLAKVSTGRAQALALTGDYRSAEKELRRTEGILNRLPSAVTSDNSSIMGWAEDRFLYTQAWVYSYMGDEARTDHATERALPMYPESAIRARAQVKFMQAFARVQSGDISEGIRHAQATYESLSSGQSTTMVNTLARRVLNPVPVEARKRSDVAEYRMLVASRIQEGTPEA